MIRPYCFPEDYHENGSCGSSFLPFIWKQEAMSFLIRNIDKHNSWFHIITAAMNTYAWRRHLYVMIAGTFLLCVILKLSKHLLIKRTYAAEGKEMNITIITFFIIKKRSLNSRILKYRRRILPFVLKTIRFFSPFNFIIFSWISILNSFFNNYLSWIRLLRKVLNWLRFSLYERCIKLMKFKWYFHGWPNAINMIDYMIF